MLLGSSSGVARGRLPKLNFLMFDGENQSCGSVVVRTILICIQSSPIYGSMCLPCILWRQQLVGGLL